MKKSLLTLIMAMIMALACATSAFAAEELGYVNVERVFRSYPDIQTTMSVINLERQKAENEFNEKAQNLDDKGRRELGEKLSMQVDKKEASLLNPIREKIRKTIGQVAKAHGINNVVDASAVVFGGKDLTEEVIAAVAQGK